MLRLLNIIREVWMMLMYLMGGYKNVKIAPTYFSWSSSYVRDEDNDELFNIRIKELTHRL